MKKITLIGYPAGHSLSPKLFELGYMFSPQINREWKYSITEEKNIETALQLIKREKVCWANITAPFKEKIMKYVAKKNRISSKIGATNLIKIDSNGDLTSFNTDYYAAKSAIFKSLKLLGKQSRITDKKELISKTTIYIIGYGGVGKATELAAKNLGITYNIYNRTLYDNTKKIERFEKDINQNQGGIKIIFYTLPTYIPLVEKIKNLRENYFVVEPNYLSASLQSSNNYISGIEWLIEQARWGFKLITGKAPNKKEMNRVAELTK